MLDEITAASPTESTSVVSGDDRPLRGLAGARPPRPAWFAAALDRAPERRMVTVEGAALELLCWGELGKPGLLFLPGLGAAASWWEPIAPFFADDYRCAALSWSGMGRSDWRDAYGLDQFTREIDGAIAAGGLAANGRPPLLVAHSFGTMPAALWGQRTPDAPGLVLVDRTLVDPDCAWRPPPPRTAPTRLYPSAALALANFRLTPPQPCPCPFLVDHIARDGLREIEAPDGSPAWTWRYDSLMRSRMTDEMHDDVYSGLTCPVAFIWGEHSLSIANGGPAYVRRRFPQAPSIVLPDAGHHVMLDQPLALIAALRTLLDTWARPIAA
ncbi:MAG: alpha/beta hydrolase [Sphingomonadaceae bacterium]|nr:alpha/beta hydrolase [Sphingomonadaceae bacterium]